MPEANASRKTQPKTQQDVELEQLRQKFKPGVVKQREIRGKRFDYVAIDATINRLLDVWKLGWAFDDCTYDVQPTTVKRRDGDPVPGFQCIVTGYLVDPAGNRHFGIGADIADDLDKALKTALAEALKKAGHQVGIGLYLWNDEDRQELAKQRQLADGNAGALKREIVRIAIESGVELPDDPEGIAVRLADHFHVTPEQLNDVDTLKQLAGVA